MKKYIIQYSVCIGIGMNQFFPELFNMFKDIRTIKITNTVAGSVSPQQFKNTHSYKKVEKKKLWKK